MQQPNLLSLSVRDFFTPPILKLAFLPFVITMVVMYALFLVAADIGLDQLEQSTLQVEQTQTVTENGVTHTDEMTATLEGGSAILSFLLKYSIFSWLLSFLVYTVGSLFVLLLSLVIALAVIGFLTPPILRIIRQRYYNDVEMVGHGHIGSIVWHFAKSFAVMLLLILLLLPFYFVPLLNIVAFNLPFYYFFHRLLSFDVGSTLCTSEEYRSIMFYKGNSVRFKTALLYLSSLIPFVALFATPFYVIYLGHTFFVEVREMRAQDGDVPDAPKSLESY